MNAALERLRTADPDRFLAVMAAPPGARAPLAVLYSFNLEIARAPWVTQEPLVARMRLQFWRDVVADPGRPRAHEVAGPLAALITARALPERLFLDAIAAREAEVEGAHLTDGTALSAYLDGSAGALMALAVRALGPAQDEVARGFGAAQGLANYLLAVPGLRAAGRPAWPDGVDAGDMARAALTRLRGAQARRAEVAPAARPALLAAWRAYPILTQAARDPDAAWDGRLGQSEFARRGGLVWAALRGY